MRTCSLEGCGNKHYAKALCRIHYVRQKVQTPAPARICDVEGCGQAHSARGFCRGHYYKALGSGTIERVRHFRQNGAQGAECSECRNAPRMRRAAAYLEASMEEDAAE